MMAKQMADRWWKAEKGLASWLDLRAVHIIPSLHGMLALSLIQVLFANRVTFSVGTGCIPKNQI